MSSSGNRFSSDDFVLSPELLSNTIASEFLSDASIETVRFNDAPHLLNLMIRKDNGLSFKFCLNNSRLSFANWSARFKSLKCFGVTSAEGELNSVRFERSISFFFFCWARVSVIFLTFDWSIDVLRWSVGVIVVSTLSVCERKRDELKNWKGVVQDRHRYWFTYLLVLYFFCWEKRKKNNEQLVTFFPEVSIPLLDPFIKRRFAEHKVKYPSTISTLNQKIEKKMSSSKRSSSSRLSAKIPSRKVPPTPKTQERNETPAKSSTSSSEDTRRSRKMTQSLPRRSPPPPPPPADDTKNQNDNVVVRNQVSNQQIRHPPTRRVAPRESGAACSCVIS